MAFKKTGTVIPADFPPPADSREIQDRSKRLREAVKGAGGNRAVADRARMHVGTLNRYLAGRDMKASAMIALADACNVSLEWLAASRGPMRPGDPPSPEPAPPEIPDLATTLDMQMLADCMKIAVERISRRGPVNWLGVARLSSLMYNEMIDIEARQTADAKVPTVTPPEHIKP